MKLLDSENPQSWQKILQGDTHEFAEFVDQHKNLITSVAYSSIGDLPGSEDIAQETFLVVWQSRQELRDPGKLVGWMCSVARNLARQWARQRSSKSWPATTLDSTSLHQDSPHPSERLVSEEEQLLVWNALETIPENYREVMILYYRESHSIADVALALEISEDAARQRLSRGRSLLRAEVERTIESALVNSRPSASFTAGVMAMVGAGWSSTAGKTLTTATAGLIGKSTAQSTVIAATQAATSGAMIGAAGGLLGVMGGLGGTWLGIRVPQLLAPTMTERKLLEREGKVLWRFSLIFLVAILSLVTLGVVFRARPGTVPWLVLTNILMAVFFAAVCGIRGVRLNRQIREIRQQISPEQDPNPTWLKDRLGVVSEPGQSKWAGRRMTSERQILGWPVYDFQVSDPGSMNWSEDALQARGWIAVGDKATGFLAIGGIAKGIIAFGGRSVGVIAFGGLSLGLISIGGLALGLLSVGGLAIGHSAIGGGAAGWQSAGGVSVGYYSANGGLAIAGTIAEGGQAISQKYAVGGSAKAPEANTETARLECEKSWVSKYLGTSVIINDPKGFRRNMMVYGTVIPVVFSVLISVGFPVLMYRRRDNT